MELLAHVAEHTGKLQRFAGRGWFTVLSGRELRAIGVEELGGDFTNDGPEDLGVVENGAHVSR